MAVIATLTTAAGLIVAAGTPAAAAPRRSLPQTAARWTASARSLGRVSAAASVTARVYLAPNGGLASVQKQVAAVSTPGSGQYRRFISAAAYHQRFDPTDTAVTAVRGWLNGAGLTVTGVEAHRRYLDVTGSAAQVEKAFAVVLNTYRHSGTTVRANTAPATVPADVAGYVSTVTGLDSTVHQMTHRHVSDAPPAPGFRNARPCSLSYGSLLADKKADFKTPLPKFKGQVLPYAVCGYTGPQLRAAYESDTTLTGKGVTVAITDAYASPTIVRDTQRYATRHGDGRYVAGQLTQVLPDSYNREDDCDPSGWYGEETLDIEAVHAMAPSANIRYYASSSCYDDDFLTTLSTVVDEDEASLVSNSWSDLESNESTANVAAYEAVLQQAALQGMGFLFSSGDDGDEVASTGLKQANYPASDPYVTSVGGTADAIQADGTFRFQTGWGTYNWSLNDAGTGWKNGGYLYGAGGGTSALFNKPDYQQGVVPKRFGSARAVPDVGLDADPQTGMLIGITQTFPDGVYYDEYRIGGTSLASPLYAGLAALASEHAGGRIGFLNPLIYTQVGTTSFTDIAGPRPEAGNVRVSYVNSVDASEGLAYFVRTFNADSSLKTAKGWDDVTGIGSPTPAWLTRVPPRE